MAYIETTISDDDEEAFIMLVLTTNEAKHAISSWDTTLEFKQELTIIYGKFNKET